MFKGVLLLLSTLFFWCGPALPGRAAQNLDLLVNGGFDLAGFPYPSNFGAVIAPWGWTGSVAYSWANDGASVGPGVVLDDGGVVGFGDGTIYQDVATTPGQIYTLTLVAHSRGTPTGEWMQPLWNGDALPPQMANYFEWTSISYQVEATGSTTRLTIAPWAFNDGPTWVDSVSLVALTAVPEPSTFCLFGLALALFMAKRSVAAGSGA